MIICEGDHLRGVLLMSPESGMMLQELRTVTLGRRSAGDMLLQRSAGRH